LLVKEFNKKGQQLIATLYIVYPISIKLFV